MRSWFASALALTASAGAIIAAQDFAPVAKAWAQQPATVISRILVEGNQRIEARTVISYLLLKPGDTFDADRGNLSIRALGATGLFSDIQLEMRGTDLVV